MSLRELDEVAGTGTYFQHRDASAPITGDKLLKAVAALDGELRIAWRE